MEFLAGLGGELSETETLISDTLKELQRPLLCLMSLGSRPSQSANEFWGIISLWKNK